MRRPTELGRYPKSRIKLDLIYPALGLGFIPCAKPTFTTNIKGCNIIMFSKYPWISTNYIKLKPDNPPPTIFIIITHLHVYSMHIYFQTHSNRTILQITRLHIESAFTWRNNHDSAGNLLCNIKEITMVMDMMIVIMMTARFISSEIRCFAFMEGPVQKHQGKPLF